MDYSKHYNDLISRAKTRFLQGYVEKHHIIPKCMGGSDDEDNIAVLLPEEHYIAHLLLVKIYPGNAGLIYAARYMSCLNNKQYCWSKKLFALQNSKDHLGLKHSDVTKEKMKKVVQERKRRDPTAFSTEQSRRAKRPKRDRSNYYKPKSAEHKQKISEAAKKRPKHQCGVCGRWVTNPNYIKHIKSHDKKEKNDLQCV